MIRGGEDFNIAEQAVNIVVIAKLLSLVCWFLNVSGCTHNFVCFSTNVVQHVCNCCGNL